MADVKISDIFAASPAAKVNNTDQFEINQAGSTAACTAEQIRGSNTIVDISAGNQTQALAAPTGSGQKVRLGWFGGDGTFTAQLTGYTLYMPDGTGLTAAQAAGEGDGFMEVQDIASRWEIVGYDDTLDYSTGTAHKKINGECDQVRVGAVVNAYPTLFTLPRTFSTTPNNQEHVASRTDSPVLWLSLAVYASAATFDLYITSNAGVNQTTGTYDVRLSAHWY